MKFRWVWYVYLWCLPKSLEWWPSPNLALKPLPQSFSCPACHSFVFSFLPELESRRLVPCNQSNTPRPPKYTLNFSWCRSCISAWNGGRKKSYPECTAAVSNREKPSQMQKVKMWERRIAIGKTIGNWLAMMCSMGWAYWAANAIGAVNVWCFLLELVEVSKIISRALLVDMFVNAREVKNSVWVVKEYFSGHHSKQEINSHLLGRR